MPDSPSADNPTPQAKPRKVVRKAIGPRLRKVLWVLWALLALMTANSGYLAGIRALESFLDTELQTYFFQWMFLGHVVLGLLLILPFLVFALGHMRNTYNRMNRRAVRVGYALFVVSLLILISGLALLRIGPLEKMAPTTRSVTYWLHVITPIVAVWLYTIHRLVGPKLKWRIGLKYGAGVAIATVLLAALHGVDPRTAKASPDDGDAYFEPSLARTAKGTFIPAHTLMNDEYCKECHPDTHADWANSAHRFSSFNNPPYLASIRETRQVSLERDGDLKKARWCAGCHDPVPFFSGAFDDPNFDDVNHPTAHAGITCTVCHVIDEVRSVRGNADYVIDEPVHYPMADSDNPIAKWVSNQLIKANPSFHKRTFLKPMHKSAEFCSSCHKVHLPGAVTDYREFLRGQNHYDSWLLSGVSGHGARSFYYPDTAQTDCNGCHMPRRASDDLGRSFGETGTAMADILSIHSHAFPQGGNTGIPWLVGNEEAVELQRNSLDKIVRVDLFGVREGATITGKLTAPLREDGPGDVPVLTPGESYLLETVIRTLKVGHHFTQGTIDSNEIWLDITAKSGDQVIGISGQMDENGEVDKWSHFVNAFVIDRDGNRIDRRNAQDIFVKLYDHQIPPGAGQLVHYKLDVPQNVTEPIEVRVQLKYRKFDQDYMNITAAILRGDENKLRGDDGGEYVNKLPITVLAEDRVVFPVSDSQRDAVASENATRDIPKWQRWNDYGIGALLKGKAELRQAEEAFQQVEKLGRYDGPLNLGRVYFEEGRLDEATAAIVRAKTFDDPTAPPWTVSWLTGAVNRQQGNLDAAEEAFRTVVTYNSEETRRRKFDFSRDYVVNNLLGQTLFDQAKRIRGTAREPERKAKLNEAVNTFKRTLEIDPENVAAHYNLSLLYRALQDEAGAERHRKLHAIYKPDDNARDRAERLAREKYPYADHAAEKVVIYELSRNIDGDAGAEAVAQADVEPAK